MMTAKERFRHEVIQSIHADYPEWKAQPQDDFAITVEAMGRNGIINLDNLYHRVQLRREPKHILIHHFLSEFARVIGGSEGPLGDFDVVKKRIELVVRPPRLYEECLGNDPNRQLAFSVPVFPDLALYWAVGQANSWQYIPKGQFLKWEVSCEEVMQRAYENTCSAEARMRTAEIGDIGLLISTSRQEGTIAHLLFEPGNLQRVIDSARPDWPRQLYWVCIPVPGMIIVAKEGQDEIIREIAPMAHEHYGKALSDRVYVFADGGFSGEITRRAGEEKPRIMDLASRLSETVLPG